MSRQAIALGISCDNRVVIHLRASTPEQVNTLAAKISSSATSSSSTASAFLIQPLDLFDPLH